MRIICAGFSGGSGGKESACKVGDLAWIPGSGRSPGEGTSNPLQNSCLENAMGRGAWQTMGGRVGHDWATTWCDVWQSVQKRTKDCLNKHIRSEFPISVQFSLSVMSYSLRPHGLQHTRPPCSSPTPRVHPNPCPLSRWCYPTISSSVVPFSSCLQSFPASESFQMSQLFTSGGHIGVSASASVLPMNI